MRPYPHPRLALAALAAQANRIVTGGGYMSLIDPNGTSVAYRSFTSGQAVTVFNFNDAQTGPIYPSNTAFQTNEANLRQFVRYVTITSTPLQCLYFREVSGRAGGASTCVASLRGRPPGSNPRDVPPPSPPLTLTPPALPATSQPATSGRFFILI